MKFSILPLVLLSMLPLRALGADADFLKGADISMLPQIENSGGRYVENGVHRDLLSILKGHGFNYVRLRIWHSPADGYCGLKRTLAMADRIRSHDLKFLLDFHYSDTWADPGKQTKPAAWTGVPFDAMRDSVYQYSFDVITALKNQNTLPDMVQIGNEFVCGMLWEDGRICGPYDTPEQWRRFTELLDGGIRGVRESLSPGDSLRIMIHIDRGGDNGGSEWFLDNLLRYGVEFDCLGLSFYPWWHGTLDDLRANLDSLAVKYDKDIVIAEAAYPWTLGWCDGTHNIVGLPEQLHAGYPATVEGQTLYLIDLIDLIARTPGGRGIGLFYCAPGYISTPGLGSPWENLTLFDFRGEVLGSVIAFETHPAETHPDDEPPMNLNLNFPSSFNPSATIPTRPRERTVSRSTSSTVRE
jgi:arabinogalactan endo-1,4-beta-galactosidase